jgi:hypothetical protein
MKNFGQNSKGEPPRWGGRVGLQKIFLRKPLSKLEKGAKDEGGIGWHFAKEKPGPKLSYFLERTLQSIPHSL